MVARDRLDGVDGPRQSRSRHGRILDVIVRREASECARGAFTRRPERFALGSTAGGAPRQCAVRASDARERPFRRDDVVRFARDFD